MPAGAGAVCFSILFNYSIFGLGVRIFAGEAKTEVDKISDNVGRNGLTKQNGEPVAFVHMVGGKKAGRRSDEGF